MWDRKLWNEGASCDVEVGREVKAVVVEVCVCEFHEEHVGVLKASVRCAASWWCACLEPVRFAGRSARRVCRGRGCWGWCGGGERRMRR